MKSDIVYQEILNTWAFKYKYLVSLTSEPLFTYGCITSWNV